MEKSLVGAIKIVFRIELIAAAPKTLNENKK
jgi:hypothetical protein